MGYSTSTRRLFIPASGGQAGCTPHAGCGCSLDHLEFTSLAGDLVEVSHAILESLSGIDYSSGFHLWAYFVGPFFELFSLFTAGNSPAAVVQAETITAMAAFHAVHVGKLKIFSWEQFFNFFQLDKAEDCTNVTFQPKTHQHWESNGVEGLNRSKTILVPSHKFGDIPLVAEIFVNLYCGVEKHIRNPANLWSNVWEAIFSQIPSTSMPPLPQLGGYQAWLKLETV